MFNSGLVLNERLIPQEEIKTDTITIKRINTINSGVRIWFQILTDDGRMFQRWSMLMNPTDEVLFLAQVGDILNIKYVENQVSDPISNTFESFTRTMILTAEYNG